MTRFEMYKVLGLEYGASEGELKEAYRKLVKKYHPDLTHTPASGLKLGKIIEAYKKLSVTARRRNLVDFPVNKGRTTGPRPAGGKKKPAPGTRQGPEKAAESGSGGGGPGGDIFSLGKLLETGKTVGMRAFAARSLGNSGKRTAYAFLRKALYDSSDLVVKAAVESIGNLRISQSYGELSSLYAKGSREVREAVLYAVSKIGVSGAFRTILESAKNDPDINLRNTARRMDMEMAEAASDG